ncbi:MAG: sporulation integral membrane protein YtvI [Oscillospiraceae bacterium]|nr:sporulation integral membrane protein YtvI [Oscillospiraceae bacterium]
MTEKKALSRVASLAIVVAGGALLWLFSRLALQWFLPFITAFFISRAIEPAVLFMTNRLRLNRALASGICSALILAAAVAAATLAVGRIIFELTAAAKNIPRLLALTPELIAELGARVRGAIASAPPEAREYITYATEEALRRGAEALGALSKGIITYISGILSGSPGFLLFILTAAVGTFFISGGYEEFTAFFLRQIPERLLSRLREVKTELRRTAAAWARAQLVLSGVTFLELTVLFCALRIDFALLLALAVSLIDMLPVLGVGAALVPWGVFELARGDAARAITLLAAFGVIVTVRGVMEPRLVGRRIGLPPVAQLIAMYSGFRAAGISGALIFTFGLIIVKLLNDKGYIRLWK